MRAAWAVEELKEYAYCGHSALMREKKSGHESDPEYVLADWEELGAARRVSGVCWKE